MAKILKDIYVSWTWEGDEMLLEGFNVAIAPQGSDPNTEAIIIQKTSSEKTDILNRGTTQYEHIFRNITLNKDTNYIAWVQSLTDGFDSEWLSATGINVSDDGKATIATTDADGNPITSSGGDVTIDSAGITVVNGAFKLVNSSGSITIDNTGITANDGSKDTFKIDSNGNASFSGSVNVGSNIAGIDTSAEDLETVSGSTLKSSGSWLRNGFEDGEFDMWSSGVVRETDSFSGNYSGLFTSSNTSPASSGSIGEPSMTIPEEIALSLAGKRVRISVFAKWPEVNESSEFAVSYSTNDTGNSGWHHFNQDIDWKRFSFYYTVPEPVAGGVDYIGIWGDTSGLGGGVLIDNVVIETMPGSENNSIIIDDAGIKTLGTDGDYSILTDDSLIFYQNGVSTPHYYSKRVAYGVAQDGDYINLGWKNEPKVSTAIRQLRSYSAGYPSRNQTYESYASGIDADGFYVYGRSTIKGTSGSTAIGAKISAQGSAYSYMGSYSSTNDSAAYNTTTGIVAGGTSYLKIQFYVNSSSSQHSSLAPRGVRIYYKIEGAGSWTHYKNYQNIGVGRYYCEIPGLAANRYQVRMYVYANAYANTNELDTKTSQITATLESVYYTANETTIDYGDVMWIAVEGGA